ncbi:MAG: MotA/TolQ/ExbB proton channel family protein [Myxococcota bacterium]
MLQQGILSFALLGAGWVLWVLVALSVLCITVSIERALFLTRDASDAGGLRAALDEFLTASAAGTFAADAVEALRRRVSTLTGFEARVLQAGLEASAFGSAGAERAIAATVTAEKIRMDRGLAVLATVGSNAPFIGLFGTVLGIIQSFHELSINTAEASEAVMGGISEALVATAVGLVVAIPAVVLYNVFTRWNRARVARAESLANLVLSRFERPTGAPHG